MGAEDVAVAHYVGGTLQGNVLGAAGGVVGTAEGDRIEVPAGALAEPTAVTLDRQAPSSLPQPVPAGTELIGVLAVDLGGRELALPAGLGFELGAAPPSGASGLLLELVDVGSSDLYRAVAALVPTATGWATAPIDAADLPWPGVRRGGRFALVRLLAPVGFFRGHVFAAAGAPRPGAVVRGSGASWVAIADADGRYVLPSPLAAVTVTAEDFASGETAAASATVAQAGQRIDLDLQLGRTAPEVVATTPGDGAVDVIPGIQPTVRFSKPVNTASLPGGIRLLEDGEDEVPIAFTRQGDLVTVSPQATLRPGTTFELRIGTGVRDLLGTPLETPVVVTFTTRESVANAGIDLSRIHLVEPTAAGQARIIGRAGAVPHDAAVFAENTSRLASTVTVEAAADGSFELSVEAGLGDTVLLHVLLTGANEVVVELGPFMTADLRSAFVDEREASFTTGDGIAVVVPAGAFDTDAVVTLTPRAPAEITVPLPGTFTAVYGFDLSFGGVSANKALQIAVPAPAGSANGRYLLSRIVDVLGEPRWMMQDLMRLDGASITTAEAPQTGAPAAALPVKSSSPDARSRVLANDAAVRPKQYVPGAGVPGSYLVSYQSTGLYFLAFPLVAGLEIAIETAPLGMVAVINREIERLLTHAAILIPALLGQPAQITVRDLTTGYRLFDGTFDPAADGEVRVLPPDHFGDDHQPPYPVAGGPIRFFTFRSQPDSTLPLGPRIEVEATASNFTVRGEAGAAEAGVAIAVVGLDDSAQTTGTSGADGSFSVTLPAIAGHRYLLAISAEVGVQDVLEIGFNEGLHASSFGSAHAGIKVVDGGVPADGQVAAAGHPVSVESIGTNERIGIRPVRGWEAGKTYHLRLSRELADAQENRWDRDLLLTIPFKVAKSAILSSFSLERVRDVARLGSLLFVAVEASKPEIVTQGLVVLDASNPTNLKSYLAGNPNSGEIFFNFPLNDPVRGVAIDPHGRVLVSGGGVRGPGQLKILDPQLLNPASTAQAQFAGVWRGSTIISDVLGGSGSQLIEGTPRRLTVLSQDHKSHWTVGQASLPIGIDVQPATVPLGGGIFTLTVSGMGGTAGAPVTLRNLDRGTWKRVDANTSGDFVLNLEVEAGDRLELLRNQKTYAYVTVQGAGITIVDVNNFYGRDDEIGSSVLGTYTGYEENLELCQQPVSDISTALLDLAALWDPDKTGHELSVLGLVGFRGLLMLTSRNSDPDELAPVGEGCASFAGTNNVVSVEVLQGARIVPPAPSPDVIQADARQRDWALVTHRQAGLLVYDITDRTNLILASRIPLPDQPSHLAIDRDALRAYVSTYSEKLLVVDLTSWRSLALVDRNEDGRDDRVLEEIPLKGITNSPVLVFPELGLAFAGGLETAPATTTGPQSGATSIAIGGPRLAAVTRWQDGEGVWRRREITRLAPYGTPTAKDGRAEDAPDLPATFQVYAGLPGWLGERVRLEVESVGPGGMRIAPAGDSEQIEGLPPVALFDPPESDPNAPLPSSPVGDHGLVLTRLAADPWQEGFNLYRSEEVTVIADLRASRAYGRTDKERVEETCPRCERGISSAPETDRELLSGDTIQVRLPESLRRRLLGTVPGAATEANYTAAQLAGAGLELASVRWDLSPAVRQEPAINPSTGVGDAVPGTLLHSGEMTLEASDLFVKGRGLDYAFDRTYRNQTVSAGPLGPGWDFAYHQRLRELPNGDVEYFDGTGRRERFVRVDDEPIAYKSPKGRFVTLKRNSLGWVLLAERGGMARFDRFGRLTAFVDPNKNGEHKGTELVFSYDAKSQLVRTEAHGREVTFEYDDDGRLTKQRDHTGREVKYEYDTQGRLEKVTSPAVTVGERKYPQGLTTIYGYALVNGNLQAVLNARSNLTSVTDPKGQRWLEVTYTDADNDGRSEEATQQTLGDQGIALTYDFEQRTTQVRDRRGFNRIYVHDVDGHPTRTQLSTAAGVISLETAYDGEGLVWRQTLPGGRLTELEYFDTLNHDPSLANYGRRQRGTIQKQTVTPAGDSNGSAAQMVTDYGEVHPKASRPRTVTNPQGATTRVRYDDETGAPVGVIVGENGPSAATTLIERNDFGQPKCILDANEHVTRFAYHEEEEGVRRGYLREVRVSKQERACGDQAGTGGDDDLVTTYEVDERGNVEAIIDPRGVRHEQVYNELDQLVEERLATTAANGSEVAPALNYVNRYLYDENGNLEEAQLAYGRDEQTNVRYVYGLLNEVREIHREITHGGSSSVERRVYDENGNVREVIGPDGQTTRNEYDERNLLVSMTRGHGSPDAATEHFELDRDGQLIARWVDNPEVEDDEEPKWKTALDGYGRLMKATDPLGNYTLTSYPDNGRRVVREHFDHGGMRLAKEEVESDDHGRPKFEKHWRWDPATAEAVPQEIVRETRYDGLSNVTEVLAPVGVSAGPQIVSTREYDFASRLEAVVDSAGNRRDFELDAGGNVIEEKVTDLGPGGAVVTSSTAGYDALNRPVKRGTPAGDWRTVFDARGNAVELEQPADGGARIRTFFDYDGLDRLTEVRRPNGITVTYGYDASSRLRTYEDALGQTTTWTYDALDRPRSVQYPDGSSDSFDYDRADNLVRHGQADGTTLTRRYDAANQLIQVWVQKPGQPAATGPTEGYDYDGLGNLTLATAGSVLSTFGYDSLGQLLRETTESSVVAYEHDAAGNRTRTSYPAGDAAFAVPEANANRPGALYFGPSLEDSPRKALYRYLGSARVAAQELGAQVPDSPSALAGTMTYDASRRLQKTRFAAGATSVFDEQVAWYPRGIQQSVSRGELNGAGMSYDYDEAGRLETARRSSGASPDGPVARTIAGLPDRFGAGYDVAENLLFLDGAEGCTTVRVELPRDDQGRRNRPKSVNGVPLEWDRNGNLKRKGNRYFHYDHRDRLVKVTDGPNADTDLLVASYLYDALDRRLSKTVGDGTRISTRWAGWQPIERYRNDTLTGRRVFGLGLDEIVSLAIDVDGDGDLETAEEYLPVYDASGNLSLVAGRDGKIVERYHYSPYGERFVIVNDSTPPRVEQVRLREGEIWIELSEEALLDDVESELELSNERVDEAIPFEVLQPIKSGPEAGRRLVIRLTGDPADESWPQVGDPIRLSLPATALVDTFGNRGETASEGWTGTTTWSQGDVMVADFAAPRLDQICVAAGKLELTFSEEPSATGLAEVLRLDGAPLTWTVQGDRYSAHSTQSVTPGSHLLSISTGELDLAGTGLAEAESETFTLPAGQTALTVRKARARGLVEQSAIGNEIGFHGLERDPETGLVYARHRYYDPEIGRFISADPLGYVDGPSMYSYAGNNPIDFTDPMGLEIGKIWNGWLSEEEQRKASQGAMSVDDGFREAMGKGTALASLAALSLVSGPIGWTALGGFVLVQMESRYEQIVDFQDRPSDNAGWQAIYYGGTDMLGIGPAVELVTGQDRVTGEELGGWDLALRAGQVLPVLAQTRGLTRGLRGYGTRFAEGFWLGESGTFIGSLGANELQRLYAAHRYARVTAGRHHLVTRGLGSPLRYGHRSLTELDQAAHSVLQGELNDWLMRQQRTLPSGRVVHMRPMAGNPGALVRRVFSASERVAALDAFYKQFALRPGLPVGAYYPAFRMELNAVMKAGGLRP